MNPTLFLFGTGLPTEILLIAVLSLLPLVLFFLIVRSWVRHEVRREMAKEAERKRAA